MMVKEHLVIRFSLHLRWGHHDITPKNKIEGQIQPSQLQTREKTEQQQQLIFKVRKELFEATHTH